MDRQMISSELDTSKRGWPYLKGTNWNWLTKEKAVGQARKDSDATTLKTAPPKLTHKPQPSEERNSEQTTPAGPSQCQTQSRLTRLSLKSEGVLSNRRPNPRTFIILHHTGKVWVRIWMWVREYMFNDLSRISLTQAQANAKPTANGRPGRPPSKEK
jgi:hypothetical protein